MPSLSFSLSLSISPSLCMCVCVCVWTVHTYISDKFFSSWSETSLFAWLYKQLKNYILSLLGFKLSRYHPDIFFGRCREKISKTAPPNAILIPWPIFLYDCLGVTCHIYGYIWFRSFVLIYLCDSQVTLNSLNEYCEQVNND